MDPLPAPALRPTLLALIRPWLLPAQRVHLRPATAADAPADPRYAGQPARDPAMPWPTCGQCGGNLAFLAQFPGMHRFWRIFLCAACPPPWSDAHRQAGQVLVEHDPVPPDTLQFQPAGTPSPWRPHAWQLEPVLSPPLRSDEVALDMPLPVAYAKWLAEQESREDLADDDTAPVFASWGCWAGVGTQLGGHAHFIQPSDPPQCPHCALPLQLLARLDTEVDVDLVWGDLGAAYLHACQRHPRCVHFEMQSP